MIKRILLTLLLLFAVDSNAQIQSLRKGNISTVSITNNISDIGWISDASNNVYLNVLTDFVGIGIADPTVALHMLSATSDAPEVIIESTNADATDGQLVFVKDSSSPADNDQLGTIFFKGDDSGGAINSYAYIVGKSEDVTDGDEAGSIQFLALIDGGIVDFIKLSGYSNSSVGEGEIIFNESSKDIDVRIESDNDANALFVQGSNGFVGLGTASPIRELHMIYTVQQPELRMETTNAGPVGPILTLHLNSASPADNDFLGFFVFRGDNSASGETPYAQIIGESSDVTDTDEAGQFEIQVRLDDALVNILELNGYNGAVGQGFAVFNEDSKDIDFRIESDNDANAFYIQGSDGFIGMGTNAPSSDLHIFTTTASIGVPLIRFESAADGALVFPTVEFYNNDPTPTDGQTISFIQFVGEDDNDDKELYAQVTTTMEDVTNGAQSGSYKIHVVMNATSVSGLEVDGYNGFVGEGNIVINEDSKDFDVRIESDNDANAFYIEGNTGDIGIGNAAPDAEIHINSATANKPIFMMENTEPGNLGPEITFIKDSATPADADRLGQINFVGDDSNADEVEYAQIRGESSDVTNTDEAGELIFNVLINGNLREFLSLNGFSGIPNEGHVIFNDAGSDIDYRFETDGDAQALFIDGGTDNVGINTLSPQTTLDVAGAITADTYNFASDGQGDDDYEIAIPGISALTTGLMVTFTANTANTGGATLEITSVGLLDALLKGNSIALATGDILAGLPVTAFFNAAGNWIIMSRLASD